MLYAEDLARGLDILHPLLDLWIVACQGLVKPLLVLHCRPSQYLRVLCGCAQALQARFTFKLISGLHGRYHMTQCISWRPNGSQTAGQP